MARISIIALLVAFAGLTGASAATSDPMVGTWMWGLHQVEVAADSSAAKDTGIKAKWKFLKESGKERSYQFSWDNARVEDVTLSGDGQTAAVRSSLDEGFNATRLPDSVKSDSARNSVSTPAVGGETEVEKLQRERTAKYVRDLEALMKLLLEARTPGFYQTVKAEHDAYAGGGKTEGYPPGASAPGNARVLRNSFEADLAVLAKNGAAPPPLATPPAAPAPAATAFQRLKTSYQQALERSGAASRAEYDAQLQRLLQKYMQAGKLDEALALKAELGHDPQKPADQEKLPPEVAPLQAQRQKATLAGAQPIQRYYVGELSKLMAESTRANRLEEAVEIKQEIDSIPVSVLDIAAPSGLGGLPVASTAGKGRIRLKNLTSATEADEVLAGAEKQDRELFRAVKELELVKFHDFAEPPMLNSNCTVDHIPGEYAKKASVWIPNVEHGNWGPYERLLPGEYFVVFRLRCFEKSQNNEIAYLEVLRDQGNQRLCGVHLDGAHLAPGAWANCAVAAKVNAAADDFEYRVSGSREKIALDRVYVFKVPSSAGAKTDNLTGQPAMSFGGSR